MSAPAFDRLLILEDGEVYPGYGFGAGGDAVLEIVFNTSMAGYQEILSDPSYTDQAVVMSYPVIGNYGMAADDYESERPSIGALVVREYTPEPSNFRSEASLGQVMERFGIPGIYGVDTRALIRSIRSRGSRKCLLTGADADIDEALTRLRAASLRRDAVARVSRTVARRYGASTCSRARFHVVAIDCGIKTNIIRSLCHRGCRVTVVPWNSSAGWIESLAPDGIFISNGPGDPTDVAPVIDTLRELIGRYPVFGICLGHQLIALAMGGRTYKLKFGHRGGNHPVKDLRTGLVEISSQNHSYAVDAASLEGTGLSVSHINLLDGTVEGCACPEKRVFSVQYHPESAPGPQDSGYLFDRFIKMMEEERKNA